MTLYDLIEVVAARIDVAYLTAQECWLSRALQRDRDFVDKRFEPVNHALEVVESAGQIDVLIDFMTESHPRRRKHHWSQDDHLQSRLSEACGLAWIAGQRSPPWPRFMRDAGAPDIEHRSGTWLEVKHIHTSRADRALTQRMVAGEAIVGQVPLGVHPTFFKKFADGYADAVKKFERVHASERWILFDIGGIDLEASFHGDAIKDELQRLVNLMGASGTGAVVTFQYEWRQPWFVVGPASGPELQNPESVHR